jgi:hypothetical protein
MGVRRGWRRKLKRDSTAACGMMGVCFLLCLRDAEYVDLCYFVIRAGTCAIFAKIAT